MVDSISGKTTQSTAGMTARLKVGSQSLTSSIGNTRAEQQLSDIVDIGSEVQDRVRKTRRLDSYLRLFSIALRYFTGQPSKVYTPLYSSVQVEYTKAENPYIKKTDKTV